MVCAKTFRPHATARNPTAAPITVPKLKNAWNSGRIVLSNCFSIAAPSTFIITSSEPLPKPNMMSPAKTSAVRVGEVRPDADHRDPGGEA